MVIGAAVYDAGSEENTESCAHIPGPPCGVHEEGDTTLAPGNYVHIHAGVHGGSDLNPATHDWRNPAAHIIIRRMKD